MKTMESMLPAFILGVGFGLVLYGNSFASPTQQTMNPGELLISLDVPSYEVLPVDGGVRLVIEDAGYLGCPGKPNLPVKRFIVALPPGTIARSVDLTQIESEELSGTYQIEPAPYPIPLVEGAALSASLKRLKEEWHANHDAIYSSDEPFPSSPVWLSARGTFRNYSYATIAFCPFTYYPESGRLIYHARATVRVIYEPLSDGAIAPLPAPDPMTRARASSLFENYGQIQDLYDSRSEQQLTSTYDYVIITTPELDGAIGSSSFVSWKTSLGHSVRTVYTTDPEIANQPGSSLAAKIRNFLRSHYLTWGIQYVLLVGDYATVPMPIAYPDPENHVYDPTDPGLVAPGTPTDYYYADLSYPDSISWDSDGDGYIGEYGEDDPDFLAEVAVGRIPVSDTTRIRYALDKIVGFEEASGPWKKAALHAAAILFFEHQNYSDYEFKDGATCIDSIERGIMNGWSITHFSEQEGIVHSSYPWSPLTEEAFNSAWRTGEYAIVNWSGHGWPDGAYRTVWLWDDGDSVPESDGSDGFYSIPFIHVSSSNLDDDHPSIVFAISCDVGWPEPNSYGNIGIDLLTLPGWGAAAGIFCSTRPAAVAGDWKENPGGVESYCYEFNRYMITQQEELGWAAYDAKFFSTTNYGWNHYYEYMNLYNYNFYGDPSVTILGPAAGVVAARGQQPEIVVTGITPNPFVATTTIRLWTSLLTHVRIRIYDVKGRLVTTLLDGRCEPGNHLISWEVDASERTNISPGIYFIDLEAGGRRATAKIVLVR